MFLFIGLTTQQQRIYMEESPLKFKTQFGSFIFRKLKENRCKCKMYVIACQRSMLYNFFLNF